MATPIINSTGKIIIIGMSTTNITMQDISNDSIKLVSKQHSPQVRQSTNLTRTYTLINKPTTTREITKFEVQ